MAFDERARIELGQRLAELLGPEFGGYLMEALPPFRWHEVATKSDLLALKSDLLALEERLEERLTLRLESRLDRAETRIIKWTVGAVFGGIAAIGASAAGIAALVG